MPLLQRGDSESAPFLGKGVFAEKNDGNERCCGSQVAK